MTMLGAPRPSLVRQFPSRRGILQRIPKAHYSTSEPKDNQERLNWDAYLRLRKQRRLAGVVTTWPTTLLAAFGSSTYFLSQKMDPTQPLFGVRTVVLTRSLTQ